MDVPPPWAAALVVAGVTGILAIIGVRSSPTSPLNRVIPHLTHALAGGLIGFMSLAFYPALPLVAAIGGMLTVRALRSSRWTDAALLAVGFGAAWTGLIGSAMVNDALDRAVSGQDSTISFAIGVMVLMGGLLLLIALSAWPGRFSAR